MNFEKLNSLTRNFLLNEGKNPSPSIKSRLLNLEEMISSIVGRSISENRKLEIIREQFSSLRRDVRRLEDKNNLLEQENKELQEKIMILEESKEE